MSTHPAFPRRDYAGLIFDCDGTLADSMPIHYLAWRETMDRYGIEFSEPRFYALGGMPSDKIVATLSVEQNVAIDPARAAREKEQAFLVRMHQLLPIEPVIAVARHFRGQRPMAVASGGYRAVILEQLEQIGCGGWFNAIVTAEDTPRHKPEPDVFLLAAERLGVPATHCLVYEDSDLGLRAAAAAGMDVIDVRHFHTPRRWT